MVSALAEETSLLMTLVTMLAAPPYSADAAARIVGGALADEGAPQIPAAALATEDAELIHRLLGRGIAVRVSLTLGCRTLPDVDSANVVGEIRGRERPQEIVVVGAHLDSWDLVSGAVLFMNEENGLHGGKAYAAAHERELHVAALEPDRGAGRPLTVAVRGGPAAQQLVAPWLAPLLQLGVDGMSADDPGGADLSALAKLGVPLAAVKQDVSRYFDLHHSAADRA